MTEKGVWPQISGLSEDESRELFIPVPHWSVIIEELEEESRRDVLQRLYVPFPAGDMSDLEMSLMIAEGFGGKVRIDVPIHELPVEGEAQLWQEFDSRYGLASDDEMRQIATTLSELMERKEDVDIDGLVEAMKEHRNYSSPTDAVDSPVISVNSWVVVEFIDNKPVFYRWPFFDLRVAGGILGIPDGVKEQVIESLGEKGISALKVDRENLSEGMRAKGQAICVYVAK